MRHSHLIEHLEAARKIAEADGEAFVAYLIKIAKEAARNNDGGKGKNIAAA